MTKKWKIYYQNTRGPRGKIIHGIKNKFTLANYDCISLSETWLNDTINSAQLFDNTYNVFRSDRNVEKYNILKRNRQNLPPEADITGGGCLIALKKNITAIRMSDWENEVPFDNVWLKLNSKSNVKTFINTIYIPGWASYDHVNLYLEQLFDIVNVRHPYANFIILGDFNLSCIKWIPNGNHCIPIRPEGGIANELINTLDATNLNQHNSVINQYAGILDLVISNVNTKVGGTTGLVKIDPYHPPLQIELNQSCISFLESKKTIKYNFFKANYNAIKDEINNIDWNAELKDDDVEIMSDNFYRIINDLIKIYTPINHRNQINSPNGIHLN